METDVEVEVRYRGKRLKTVSRPLRVVNGQPHVTYKGKMHPLMTGNVIELGASPREDSSLDEMSPTESAEAAPAVEQPQGEDGANPVWDEKQRLVIEDDASARQLISACPGAGKTAVTCARVAYLIDSLGVSPSAIIVVSFSRAAVQEIRARICRYLREPTDINAIKIATIDSYAWQVHSGFAHSKLKLTDYEENIEGLIELVEEDEVVRDSLYSLQHVFVDEAQDILSSRAELIEKIFDCLSADCGITVLGDPAQAIYGFANEDDDSAESQENLMDRLQNEPGYGFRQRDLDRVYRTASERLRKLYTETRREVLAVSESDQSAPQRIAGEIANAAAGRAAHPADVLPTDLDSRSLMLFRRRAEVLEASAFLNSKGVLHRIRMSRQPHCLYPWIAAALGGDDSPVITRELFSVGWQARCQESHIHCDFSEEDAWGLICHYASKPGQVRRSHLLSALATSRPPAQLCFPEYGFGGPVLGTIHASKGREAERVHLMLPAYAGAVQSSPAEEARVAFVGATRARAELRVGNASRSKASCIRDKRTYRKVFREGEPPAAIIQVGCDGDITAESMAGKTLYSTPEHCQEVQEHLLAALSLPLEAASYSDRSREFAHSLYGAGKCWGWIDPSAFKTDLWEIGKAINKGNPLTPPERLKFVWIIGVRSIAVVPDSPEGRRLHASYSSAGLLLAPMIIGFTKAFFKRKGFTSG
ncbi:MAG: UvrD-helicase domain-containing protein [Pseudomonadota bacterium]